ncbi:MAG TPA: hypothetical protein VLA83_01925 [Candidatus Binatia bacterium]|nr:hypothetical protein [Candidatus Binatia bacterium]
MPGIESLPNGKSMLIAEETSSSQTTHNQGRATGKLLLPSMSEWKLLALNKTLHTYFRYSALFKTAHIQPEKKE